MASAGQSYELRVPVGPCHGPIGGYAGMSTDRDIAAGEPVTIDIGDPFQNGCGRSTVRTELFYDAAGYPPREVGSVDLRKPPGTRSLPAPRSRQRPARRR